MVCKTHTHSTQHGQLSTFRLSCVCVCMCLSSKHKQSYRLSHWVRLHWDVCDLALVFIFVGGVSACLCPLCVSVCVCVYTVCHHRPTVLIQSFWSLPVMVGSKSQVIHNSSVTSVKPYTLLAARLTELYRRINGCAYAKCFC